MINLLTDLEKYEKLGKGIEEILKDLDIEKTTLCIVIDEYGNLSYNPSFVINIKSNPKKINYSTYETLDRFCNDNKLKEVKIESEFYHTYDAVSAGKENVRLKREIKQKEDSYYKFFLETEMTNKEKTRRIVKRRRVKDLCSYGETLGAVRTLEKRLETLGYVNSERERSREKSSNVENADFVLEETNYLFGKLLDMGLKVKKITTYCAIKYGVFVTLPFFVVDIDGEPDKISYKIYNRIGKDIIFNKPVSFSEINRSNKEGIYLRIDRTYEDVKKYINKVVGLDNMKFVEDLKNNGFEILDQDQVYKSIYIDKLEEFENTAEDVANYIKSLEVVETHLTLRTNELGEILEYPEVRIFVENDPYDIEYEEVKRIKNYASAKGIKYLKIEPYPRTTLDKMKTYFCNITLLSEKEEYLTSPNAYSNIRLKTIINVYGEKHRYIRETDKKEETEEDTFNNFINQLINDKDFEYSTEKEIKKASNEVTKMFCIVANNFEKLKNVGVTKFKVNMFLNRCEFSFSDKRENRCQYKIYLDKNIEDVPYEVYEFFRDKKVLLIADDEEIDFGYKEYEIDKNLEGVHLSFDITSDDITNKKIEVIGNGNEEILQALDNIL